MDFLTTSKKNNKEIKSLPHLGSLTHAISSPHAIPRRQVGPSSKPTTNLRLKPGGGISRHISMFTLRVPHALLARGSSSLNA